MNPNSFQEFDAMREKERKEKEFIKALQKAREEIINLNSLLNPHWGSSDLEETVKFLDEAVLNYF